MTGKSELVQQIERSLDELEANENKQRVILCHLANGSPCPPVTKERLKKYGYLSRK